MRTFRLIVAAALVAALSGCAMWTRVETANATLVGPGEGWSIDAPVGWVQLSLYSDGIRLTRDGFQIQLLDATLSPHERALERTKKTTHAKLLPSELAELLIAELRSTPGMENLALKETAPAPVAGRNGFRARLQYRNERGVTFDVVLAGAALPEGRMVFFFQVIDRYFYARDLPAFEQVLGSWRSRRAP